MDETPQEAAPASNPTFRHTVERKPGAIAVLTVEVDAERLSRAVDRVFERRVRQARIPGFRPGKAPRALYERTYGAEHLLDEGAEDLVEDTYREIVRAEGLDPLDSPSVEITALEPGKPLAYTATVAVRPDVRLGDYKAHGSAVQLEPVTDADVTKTIDGMRDQHAELRPVERAAAAGDVVTVDIDLAVEDGPSAAFGRNAHLEIGREYGLPGLAEGLVGAAAGDERVLTLVFPDDYPDVARRGKSGAFTVRVSAVAEKVLPALDDGFAKTMGVADVAALDRAVRGELWHAAFHEARDAAAQKVLDHLLATAEVEVPEILVAEELDHLVADLQVRLKEQGLAWEQFLLQARRTEAEIRADWRDAALRRAKSLLVLDAVAKAEGVTVTSNELAQEVALTPLAQQDARALRDPRVLGSLARSMRNRKIVDKLLGLEGADAEREFMRAAGAPLDTPDPHAQGPELVVPEAKPEATAEGREAIRRMLEEGKPAS